MDTSIHERLEEGWGGRGTRGALVSLNQPSTGGAKQYGCRVVKYVIKHEYSCKYRQTPVEKQTRQGRVGYRLDASERCPAAAVVATPRWLVVFKLQAVVQRFETWTSQLHKLVYAYDINPNQASPTTKHRLHPNCTLNLCLRARCQRSQRRPFTSTPSPFGRLPVRYPILD